MQLGCVAATIDLYKPQVPGFICAATRDNRGAYLCCNCGIPTAFSNKIYNMLGLVLSLQYPISDTIQYLPQLKVYQIAGTKVTC